MTHSLLRLRLIPALTVAVLAGAAPSQIGWRDEDIANTTGVGSALLTSRVYYPATRTGLGAPLRPQAGGYPVVVFLHGLNSLGQGYRQLADHLVDAGFIAVHSDTALVDSNLQRDDGHALFASLQAENLRAGSFFEGALDMGRAALCGHSMGGANTVRILADNPGYRTGICFAPWQGTTGFPAQYGPSVAAPLLIIHGEGDTVLPWESTAQAYFDEANGYAGLKTFVLLDENCTHGNLIRFGANATAADREVFERSIDVALGWLAENLQGQVNGLEQVMGPQLVGDPRVTQLQTGVRKPRLWASGAAVPGGSFELHVAGEPGLAVLMMAHAPGVSSTPVGQLLLDRASLDWVVTFITGAGAQVSTLHVPHDPNLLGFTAHFQAITSTDGRGFRMTNCATRTVTR